MNWDTRPEWSFARILDDDDDAPPPAFAARRAASPKVPLKKRKNARARRGTATVKHLYKVSCTMVETKEHTPPRGSSQTKKKRKEEKKNTHIFKQAWEYID